MTEPTPDLDNLQLVPLPGSERSAAPGAEAVPEPLDTTSPVEVTLVLRRREELPNPAVSPRLSRAQLAEGYGAEPGDVDTVTQTLGALGLEILEADAGSRRVRASGSVELVSRVFGVTLEQATSRGPRGRRLAHRHRTGGLSVPAQLAGIVTAVLGLDDRPQARMLSIAADPKAVTKSFTPPQLGAIYRFPADTDGTGQTISIVELGGGFDQADLDTYFSGLELTKPSVTAVGVDGASNQPDGDPNGADGEVLLDIEVAGALAPAADVVVYFAPNTDAGFLDAVSQAAHADPTPTVISISWGQAEDGWTAQALHALDQAMADAVSLGVTVTAASGDDGSADRTTDGRNHVDFPASSPHALGCGGTKLVADAATAEVTSETVWNNGPGNGASGGGVSGIFGLPPWQQAVGVPGGSGRGVPDVAADADPTTGYQVRVDGQDAVFGGTSAVAPLWAALVARLAQGAGAGFGLIQPLLYAGVAAGSPAAGFRDIIEGDNGAFSAGPGWDACTGLGVPGGQALVGVVQPAGG